MHVRTPITLAVVVLLVVILSGFCYYRLTAPVRPAGTPAAAPPQTP